MTPCPLYGTFVSFFICWHRSSAYWSGSLLRPQTLSLISSLLFSATLWITCLELRQDPSARSNWNFCAVSLQETALETKAFFIRAQSPLGTGHCLSCSLEPSCYPDGLPSVWNKVYMRFRGSHYLPPCFYCRFVLSRPSRRCKESGWCLPGKLYEHWGPERSWEAPAHPWGILVFQLTLGFPLPSKPTTGTLWSFLDAFLKRELVAVPKEEMVTQGHCPGHPFYLRTCLREEQ